MSTATVSPVQLRQVSVLGSTMAYREAGQGSGGRHGDSAIRGQESGVVLFLHGNPTSSYIWRNVIPHVAPYARCIAPDLIGFGRSGKPAIGYRFADHLRYVGAFVEALGLDRFFIVAHDWGTAIAFHIASAHPERVRGLAFMEFMRPMPTWEDFEQAAPVRDLFKRFRGPEGERLLLDENLFIERVLPGATVRTLSASEMAEYRAPFPTRESRRPIWRFPSELPIAGEPADVYGVVERDHAALLESTHPKLLFCGDPGALISPSLAEEYARRLHHCRLVRLGAGRHYLQEDHPDVIGDEVAAWVREHSAT